jgi:uncharacterized membrane protein
VSAFSFRLGVARIFSAISRLDSHHRVAIAVIISLVVPVALRAHPLWTISLTTYDSYAFISLILIWITIAFTPRERIRAVAKRQDVGTRLIFLLVVLAASAAVIAVALLLRAGRSEKGGHFTIHLLLALITVVLSWLLMHSVFGLRYAHTFYGDSDEASERHAGGLLFPGEEPPDYSDFAYFSFVIGMTCQVSDVQITSGELRNLALVHGMISFAFNTVVLALTVNIVAGLW